MKRYSPYLVLIAVLLFMIIYKFQLLYAEAKYLGMDWNFGASSINFIGDFDDSPGDDAARDRYHWLTQKGGSSPTDAPTLYYNSGQLVSTVTADASPKAIELDNGDTIYYVSGGIDDNTSWSATNASARVDFFSQWGEGDDVMTSYTHIGFYAYNETPSSDPNNVLKVLIKEADLVDTQVGAGDTGDFYYSHDDPNDTFPVGFYSDQSLGMRDGDEDGVDDVELEGWMAEIQKDWKGWKFILLRLGYKWGSGTAATAGDYVREDTQGDFSLTTGTLGDQRFNIREVRGKVGNPNSGAMDGGDSWLIDGSAYGVELKAHYKDGAGTTLPEVSGANHFWWRGDVEGLKWVAIYNHGTGKVYIDNLMLTTPIPSGTTATDTMRVDYAWLSDSLGVTLYDSADTPLATYTTPSNGSSPVTADINMRTFYGSLWYTINGYIPPTFSAILEGDVSDTRSRIAIVSQDDWNTLLNTTSQPYFYGNGTVGASSPTDATLSGDILATPNSLLSYDEWYTMFVSPRQADGDDTRSSYGYPQVVNFKFTKPNINVKVHYSEELTN